MPDTKKGSEFTKPLPFLQNSTSFDTINPPGCSPPPKPVSNSPRPPYPSHASFAQVPYASPINPYDPLFQLPHSSGYNLPGYSFPQPNTFTGYEYMDYGSYNSAQDVQYSGHLHQSSGSNTPSSYTSMVQSTYQYSHLPLVTDITKPPPIFPNTYTPSQQSSSSESKGTNYVFNTKSDSKRNDKNYHIRSDKRSNEDPKSTDRKHNYSRSEYSSTRDRQVKLTSSNYQDDQLKHRSHKSHDDSRHRSDRSYKDDSVRSRDTHTKHNRSTHRSYSEKPDRNRTQEKSTYNDAKSRRSCRRSRSPAKRSPSRYRSCSVSKSKKSFDNNIPEKNKPDKDHYENRNQISNSIEKACENLAMKSSEEEKSDDEDEPLSKRWYRSSPAELYYVAVDGKPGVVESTPRARKVTDAVREKLIDRGKKSRPSPGTEPIIPPRTHRPKLCKHKSEHVSSTDSSSGSENDEADHAMQELERKQQHPRRLHPEMWYNDPGEMNDGPLCRCSARTRRQGIRHGVYAAEMRPTPCNIYTNNADKLYHYRITISPPTNFLIKTLTVISHDEHEFLFSGFSLLSHYPLTKLPTCKVIRFNIEYTILYIEEQAPINYTIEELELFEEFLFREILELVDLDMGQRTENGCSQFHLLPRWERALGGGGGEVLAMVEVLKHLIKAGGLLLPPNSLKTLRAASQREWQSFVDGVRGMIVTYPGKKPCSVRVDQLDRSLSDDDVKCNKDEVSKDQSELIYPEIVHFGIRPPQLSYAGNPEYKKAWRDYVKFRHLVANMAKPSYEDKRKLESKEARLQEMRTQTKMKRDVTVALSAEGFYRTGIMCDVVQHAMLIPVLISHLRFHNSLNNLEKTINYKFENRSLLQLALTHPSYRDNFGTNPDHARNSLTNCGIRQPEYGDRRIHYMNIRKRGINTLINIMSRFGKKQETESAISHNERLEFLGDAVVEFISSIHLFKMFPSLEEGGLATYRAAIVQNQHLAQLAKKLGLEQYMLYAHGSDLCHDLELRHAMANCFEALMGALFLDGGIDVADRVFAIALWKDQPELLEAWKKPRLHPLQEQEPYGDRRWLDQYPFLQNLTKFEDSIGIKFTHIRLLARAFTDRSMGFTNLTLGSNQRLEFLGDTVLQLISSEHLYKHFPEHHEGHLSLLRSSLVNNRTQAVVCDDLAMSSYAVYHNPKAEPKTKDKADLLEAFLGALYIDKNIEFCHSFCSVCLFPRLREFIMNQEWNDPKSKLQQCCLTLRTMDGAEPDIPIYKVIECVGPTNTREYTVAVYFRGERLASARGHCIQEAEMNAAKQALTNSHNLFPQLDRQKRVIAKSMKRQRHNTRRGKYSKLDYDNDKDKSENHNSKDSSRRRRTSLDRSPGNNDSKQKRNKVSLDKFPSIKDKDKLPMAYRPDRFDNNKNDDDSDNISTNLNKGLIEISDMDSDIIYSDDNSLEKLSGVDSDA